MIQTVSTFRRFLSQLIEQDRDPFLDELRWRLHLRLLLVSGSLTATFLIQNILYHENLDLGLGLTLTVVAWFFVRRFPQYNRWVVRVVLALFLSLALHGIYQQSLSSFSSAFLALMLIPIFATLLDGALAGAATYALAQIGTVLWLHRFYSVSDDATLSVLFNAVSSLGLYFCSVAQTWFFVSLVQQRRTSSLTLTQTSRSTESLADTLTQNVFKLSHQLIGDIKAMGLLGLQAAQDLNAILQSARQNRPVDRPLDTIIPIDLLELQRRQAFRFFLRAGIIMSALAALSIVLVHVKLWELALGVSLLSLGLYYGSEKDPSWRWRLRVFLWAGLLACSYDFYHAYEYVGRTHLTAYAVSFIFLPTLLFFAFMLDRLTAALVYGSATLALVGLAAWLQGEVSYGFYGGIGIMLPAMVGIVLATLPMYQQLLQELGQEEARLAVGFSAYRRMFSTFFHDLANPLAVLTGLAQLPRALQAPSDTLRALRMADRIDSVARAATLALSGDKTPVQQSTLSQLGDELYDLFRERLRDKELQWVVGGGPEIEVPKSGPLLRDSILGNLVSNAVKFTAPGGRIELKAWKSDQAAHVVLSDTGRGIPPQVMESLAQGRVPVSEFGTQGEGGTGYGLLLAQTYMQELGGRLVLRPRPQGGTEAELILPLN